MDIVLSIDCARGKCWTALQSLQLKNFNCIQTDKWSKALQLIETETVALVLCNLDIPEFQADELFNLLRKLEQPTLEQKARPNFISSIVPMPVLICSELPDNWHQFTPDQLAQIELCPATENFDYVKLVSVTTFLATLF